MLALALHAAPSFAQTYPAKALRIVVAYAPGGTNDISARAIGQKLTELWGVPVIVDNRPGGGTVIGTELVAKSPPDGYTLLLTPPSFTTNPTYLPKLPYDTLKDFAGVTSVSDAANVLVVAPQLKVKTMRELIDYGKTHAGQVNFASAGISSAAYINAELFNQAAGVKPVHVPYKTMPDALTNIIAGNVQFVFSSVSSAVALIKYLTAPAAAATIRKAGMEPA